MSDNDISHLHPLLQPLCRTFLEKCTAAGLDVRITFTYRSPEEQDALYAKGRTAPGKRVTNVRGGFSKHNFRLDGKPASKAFDFGIFDKGKYIKNGKDARYTQAGEIGESLGLAWGGRWEDPFDAGHLQLPR